MYSCERLQQVDELYLVQADMDDESDTSENESMELASDADDDPADLEPVFTKIIVKHSGSALGAAPGAAPKP